MKSKLLVFLNLFILISTSTIAQNEYEVMFRTGKQIFPENVATYPKTATIGASEVIEEHYYRLLQFYKLPNVTQLETIKKAGIKLLEYIPNKTYLAAIPVDFDLEELVDLDVRSISEIGTQLKMSTALQAENLPEWAMHSDGKVEVMLQYHENLRHEEILRYCNLDGIQVLQANGFNNFLLAAIPQNNLTAIANLPYISFLELRPAPDVKDDTEGRSLHRANAIDTNFPTGRSYTGEGISVLTRDDGAVGPHIDFQGRIFQDISNGFGGTHGDGVSGIFAGAGNLNPRNKGMASGADLYVINYDASFLDETMNLFFNNEVIVTNSSYSNGCNDGYTTTTATVDQQIFNNPTLMHVFSAGNSNNNDCGYGAGDQWGNITGGHKQGKNVIATANLFNNATLANSSSRGPAHDGRIKPDIAANGADHISTDPDNTYAPFGGTSGAAPGIAGIMAMLHQAYAEHNNGETAASALLKAIMLNTANDLGNKGPDFRFGWGHVNAYRAAVAIEENRFSQNHSIALEETQTHTINIPENVAEVRIMTYWMDNPASVMTSKALINDLNTSVIAPDGTVNLPWVLDPTPDPTALNSPAETGIDDLNNMEQISITNPEAGDYILNVEGFEVPFGGHDYLIVYEFLMEDITVLFPIGGERLVPSQTERIHWDAPATTEDFILDYSEDNGTTWTNINTVSNNTRMYNWSVPATSTGQGLFRISHASGISDVSDAAFSIAEMPETISVNQICPEYLRIEWDSVTGASNYDVYLLGQKYMDIVVNTNDTFADIFIPNPLDEYWVAVSANHINGATSRRTNARSIQGEGLINCQQEVDLRALAILSPLQVDGISCENPFMDFPTISILNDGMTPQTNIEVSYQFANMFLFQLLI